MLVMTAGWGLDPIVESTRDFVKALSGLGCMTKEYMNLGHNRPSVPIALFSEVRNGEKILTFSSKGNFDVSYRLPVTH